MATRTRLSIGRAPARSLLALGLSAAVALGAGAAVPTTAAADPPLTIAQVQHRIAALNAQVDVAVEQYDQAQLDLAAAKRQLATARDQVTVASHRLEAIRAQISAVAAAAYRTGIGGDALAIVGSSDPQRLLDQASALDQLSRQNADAFAQAAAAQHDLSQQQQIASQAVAKAAAIQQHVASRRAFIQASLATEKRLLAGLQAKARAQLAAQRAAAAARERAAAQRAVSVASSAPVMGSGGASVAVQWAYRELGKPYVWAASGPNTFDCSGLTMYVWAKAGVSLPHSAAAQIGSGTRVSQSQLQPGDLVFFGSPIHHVGIYIGNGQMIEAPHTGADVRIASISRPDFAGATRP